jgi:sugar/nucleoside kinase (ribokinase family)
VDAVNLKARLALLDDRLSHTRVILGLARELEEINDEEHTLDAARAERLRAVAVKACFLKREVDGKASGDVLKRALKLYKEFSGDTLTLEAVDKELDELLTRRELKEEVE